eukprot:m.184094 g.184094  ORF g.184094 m.184094 type:complete len:486 (-) comp13595_c1_seq12:347-1804(-)
MGRGTRHFRYNGDIEDRRNTTTTTSKVNGHTLYVHKDVSESLSSSPQHSSHLRFPFRRKNSSPSASSNNNNFNQYSNNNSNKGDNEVQPHTVQLVDVGHRRSTHGSFHSNTSTAWMEFKATWNRVSTMQRQRSQNENIFLICAALQFFVVVTLEPLVLRLHGDVELATIGSYAAAIIPTNILSMFLIVHGSFGLIIHELYGGLLLNVLCALHSFLQLFELIDIGPNNNTDTAIVLTSIILGCITLVVIIQAFLVAPIYEQFGEVLFNVIPSPPVQELFQALTAIRVNTLIVVILDVLFVVAHALFFVAANSVEIYVLVFLLVVDVCDAFIPFYVITHPQRHNVLVVCKVWLLAVTVGYLFKIIQLDQGLCDYCQYENVLSLSLAASVNLIVTMISLAMFISSHQSVQRNLHAKVQRGVALSDGDKQHGEANQRINSRVVLDVKPPSEFKFKRVSSYRVRQSAVLINTDTHVGDGTDQQEVASHII